MITANVMTTVDITAGIIILDDAGIVTDSYAWHSDQHE